MFVYTPVLLFAQFDSSNAESLMESISEFLLERIIPTLVLLALVYTVYAGFSYVAVDPDSTEKEDKKKKIFWGIIGLFVIVSIWSLVAVVGRTFNLFAGGSLRP